MWRPTQIKTNTDNGWVVSGKVNAKYVRYIRKTKLGNHHAQTTRTTTFSVRVGTKGERLYRYTTGIIHGTTVYFDGEQYTS